MQATCPFRSSRRVQPVASDTWTLVDLKGEPTQRSQLKAGLGPMLLVSRWEGPISKEAGHSHRCGCPG